METTSITRLEVFHKSFNLDHKDNLDELPEAGGVFGIFAVVNEEPLNCRLIAESDNIRQSVKELFENPPSEGLKKFMQGPWIQMCIFEIMADDVQARKELAKKWSAEYEPKIDEEGEYPGYYEY